ncbi:PLP-dependent transferase [Flavobacterium ginsengisoli]|uniref:PLP-dependent transferase n=1 Tax=Flavobacterium ginsengisoli TaxID=871694 RepID=UPI002415367E|nr:PLP-dependent transferase [Flavobacterium ginsengisoli]
MNTEEFGFETQAIRTQLERSQYLEHSVPLYLSSSFVFEDAEDMRASFTEEKERNIYSRFSNPNTSEFVDKICKMEGADSGYAFATGMAAVYSTFASIIKFWRSYCFCKQCFRFDSRVVYDLFSKMEYRNFLFRN